MSPALVIAFMFFVVVWAVPTAMANGIGHQRNRPYGWVYGALLGWLGVLILSLTQPLPTQAELEVRQLEAQQKLNEMRTVGN
jgi:hypothetical protein